jgi:hypothetical protein
LRLAQDEKSFLRTNQYFWARKLIAIACLPSLSSLLHHALIGSYTHTYSQLTAFSFIVILLHTSGIKHSDKISSLGERVNK